MHLLLHVHVGEGEIGVAEFVAGVDHQLQQQNAPHVVGPPLQIHLGSVLD